MIKEPLKFRRRKKYAENRRKRLARDPESLRQHLVRLFDSHRRAVEKGEISA